MHILTSHDSVWGASYDKFWPEKIQDCLNRRPTRGMPWCQQGLYKGSTGKTGGSAAGRSLFEFEHSSSLLDSLFYHHVDERATSFSIIHGLGLAADL